MNQPQEEIEQINDSAQEDMSNPEENVISSETTKINRVQYKQISLKDDGFIENKNHIAYFRKVVIYKGESYEVLISQQTKYTIYVIKYFTKFWFFKNCLFQRNFLLDSWKDSFTSLPHASPYDRIIENSEMEYVKLFETISEIKMNYFFSANFFLDSSYFFQLPMNNSVIFDSLGNDDLINYLRETEFKENINKKTKGSIFDAERYEGYKHVLIGAWGAGLISFVLFLSIGLQIMIYQKEKLKMNQNQNNSQIHQKSVSIQN